MFESDSYTSGFVDAVDSNQTDAYGQLEEIYVSTSGYTRLFRCEKLGRAHILKTLKPVNRGSAFYEQALRKEFVIGYQLEHPHICRTQQWEVIPSLGNCIVLEYIDGISLETFMERGLLNKEVAYKLIDQLCSALTYLHSKQIIHRDLKPTNIMVTHNGQNCKLIDFSLSDSDDYTILKMPAGTRYYLAPESLEAGATPSPKWDIFSLGVLIGQFASKLKDKRLASISRKCTQRNPTLRYSSAAQISVALHVSSRLRPSVVGITSLIASLCVVLFWWWQSASAPMLPPQPVYGNQTLNLSNQRLLQSERIRLHRLSENIGDAEISRDSLLLMQHIRRNLATEFPFVEGRPSLSYQKTYARMVLQVDALYRSVRNH